MEVRLCPNLGRDGTRQGIQVLNDTGSNLLTLFYTDLAGMGPYQQYWGWLGNLDGVGCGGQIETLQSLDVEIRLVRPDTFLPWGNWLREKAVLRMLAPEVSRLSGALMRQHLFFGTPPGNHHGAVGDTKGGMNAVI